MENITQKELDYLIDLVESDNPNDWDKAKVDLDTTDHRDSIRKAFNTTKYCGYNIYKFMQDKIEKGILTDEQYLKLEKKRDEEYKERVRLQDANREKRKVLREFSRMESLLEYIEKKLDDRKPIDFEMCDYKISNANEASILIGDLHCGATVDSIFNYYDVNTLKERMEELANKAILFCKNNNVGILHVELLGDFITGIIHGSTIAQAEEDVVDQIFDVCEILSEFIRFLRREIPVIKVYSVFGNHGRCQKGKADGANKENFERLVAPYIRKELRNTDIKVFDSGYEDFLTYRLKDGRLIVSTHGTNDSPDTANKTFTKLLEQNVFEVHMGHFHSVKSSKGTTVNGSVMGSDDYATSRRFNEKPTQVLKVYYENDDVADFKLTMK